MVTGEINAFREIVFTIPLQDGNGDWHDVRFALDTGFDGDLTLPTILIEALRLPFANKSTATLGDGSDHTFATYDTQVRWDNVERQAIVLAAEGFPLIGTKLVYGYALYLHIVDGASAVAVRLP